MNPFGFNRFNPYDGLRITVSEHAVHRPDAVRIRRRSWRERWFSWPWNPRRRWASDGPYEEPAAFQTPIGLIVHPTIYARMKQ